MEMLVLLLVLGFIAALILPWVNMARISGQRRELKALQREFRELQNQRDSTVQASVVPVKKPTTTVAMSRAPSLVAKVETPKIDPKVSQGSSGLRPDLSLPKGADTGSKSGNEARQGPGNKADEEARGSVEAQDWFSKIAVWVGGIALLMAGFYMIKYSMESGWLTPTVRISLTTGFGALLCNVGVVIGMKSGMGANKRIGQALSGAGIACLYFAAYAAVHLYSFLSPGQGFVAMLAVTALAVGLSLKNGAPIAMMGLVGGFLTPWLMSTGSNDTAMLFGYLFLLFCGAQFLCVRRGWWVILLGSLVGAYLWSAVVIVGNLYGALDNLEGTLIFVLGICFLNAFWAFLAKQNALDQSTARLLTVIRLMTWGGGLVQGLVLVFIGGFAAVDLILFGLLSVGALVLSVLKEEEFIWAGWLALIAVAASTLSNTDAALWSWLLAPLGLMGLFFMVGHWRGLSSARALTWRNLSVSAALVIVPLLYLNREFMVGLTVPVHASIWLWMAGIWAGLLALAGEHLFRRDGDAEVAGEYSAFAVFLLGFGLWAYVPVDYQAHTAAGLLIASTIYWKQRSFGRSMLVVSVLGLAWGARMYLYAGDACAYFFGQETYYDLQQDGFSVLAWALGLIGGGAVFGLFRRDWSEKACQNVIRIIGVVGLLSLVVTYQWIDQDYMPAEWTSMTVEGGLTTLLTLTAVIFIFLARKWDACGLASVIVAGLVGLRIAVLHAGDAGAQGESFFLNALLLQFGVPFVAACLLAWQSGRSGSRRLRRVYQFSAMLLGFVWASFLVQDYYGGSELFGGHNSSTEIYTYSVVWLLLAVAYQAIGLWRNQSAIHIGSLILLLITITKVFLVDASELEGLFRVLSFLGLGLALIGIGFFYNKVVFARQEAVRAGKSQSTEK